MPIALGAIEIGNLHDDNHGVGLIGGTELTKVGQPGRLPLFLQAVEDLLKTRQILHLLLNDHVIFIAHLSRDANPAQAQAVPPLGSRSYCTAAVYSSGLKPTSNRLPRSSIGRLIAEGCASISLIALSALRFALSFSGSLRKLMPARLSTVSQPSSLHHVSSRFRSIPSFL